jgi:hypothetical protein
MIEAGQPAIQYHGVTTGRFPPSKLNFGRVTHTVYPVKYMVVVGTLGQGFDFYGPFNTAEKATAWARHNLHIGVSVTVEKFHDVREDA